MEKHTECDEQSMWVSILNCSKRLRYADADGPPAETFNSGHTDTDAMQTDIEPIQLL